MNLFRKWFAQYSNESHPKYVQEYFRSQEIESQRYMAHPFFERITKWDSIPLEDEEKND